MSRIDAPVATQIADVQRPAQSSQERVQQSQAAQVQSTQVVTPLKQIGSEDLRSAAAQLKQVVETASNRKLAFEVDQTSGSFYVQVRDLNSGDLIKQIPSEEMLRLRERLDDLIGIFLDEKA